MAHSLFFRGFPGVPHLLEVQFALANGPVFMGCFIYRNSFAFHNLDKMTTCLIHILPPLISYCIRWFPEASSVWWWHKFEDTSAAPQVENWYHVNNWIYLYAIPNAVFIVHCIIYHVVVHVIFKPSEKYNDSYRYLCTKTTIVQKPKQKLPPNFFVHTAMLFVIFFDMTWNGACYFVDYLPTLALRKAIADGTIPAPQAQTSGAKSGKGDETDDELDGDEIEVGDEASVEYEMGDSEDEDY
ncbi:unnamed protein product [Dibothriocephalus latus]|uniref:Glycerophosphocholine acyltransferase 1 n=1 Tax=Dibothriocephalus latus TaxID=60516 RepID=A0A3P7NYI6_DIBLA|nr:unnamed protein product [Dibothriocephalus latus]